MILMNEFNFVEIGKSIGKLVTEKNKAYGDAFNQSSRILDVLYPNGIKPHQYQDILTIIRIIDKLFRIANQKDAFGESPWNDICGYAILAVERSNRNKTKSSTNDNVITGSTYRMPSDAQSSETNDMNTIQLKSCNCNCGENEIP